MPYSECARPTSGCRKDFGKINSAFALDLASGDPGAPRVPLWLFDELDVVDDDAFRH